MRAGNFHINDSFAMALFAMLIFGVYDMIRGVVGPSIMQHFHIDYAWLGFLFATSSFGYLAGSFISGFLIERRGLKTVMIIGIVLLASGLLSVSLAPTYMILSLGYVGAGFGTGLMEISVNSLIPIIALHHQSRFFNVLHGAYGMGATFAPIVVAMLLSAFHVWQLPYELLLALVFVLGVTVSATPFGHPHTNSLPQHGSVSSPKVATPLSEVLQAPKFYLLLMAIMLYVVAEVGLANWLPTLLRTTSGFSVSNAAWYLTLFFLLLTIGRFAGSMVVHRMGSIRSVVLSSLLAFVSIGLADLFTKQFAILFALSGLFFGVIFPTISSIASEAFPSRTGTVMGFLFTFAAIGSVGATWLIGVVSDFFGLVRGILVVDLSLFLTAVLMVALSFLAEHASATQRGHQPPL